MTSEASSCWDQGLTAEKALELGKAEIAREKAERAARQPVFDVDPNRMVFVRLNEFANVQNPDFKIPWGVTDWRGMRFDFIRFDQNQFKDVIKVEKSVKGIAVDSRAAFLYFAHTAAPVYRVVYDDKIELFFKLTKEHKEVTIPFGNEGEGGNEESLVEGLYKLPTSPPQDEVSNSDALAAGSHFG